jgi:hypothetical protein
MLFHHLPCWIGGSSGKLHKLESIDLTGYLLGRDEVSGSIPTEMYVRKVPDWRGHAALLLGAVRSKLQNLLTNDCINLHCPWCDWWVQW